MHAISGLEIALWDLAGKVAKLPLIQRVSGHSRATASARSSLSSGHRSSESMKPIHSCAAWAMPSERACAGPAA